MKTNNKNFIKLPCSINDIVYTLGVRKSGLETLLTSGEVIERKVDEIIINSKGIEVHSYRTRENDSEFYGYLDEIVFTNKKEAEEKLKKLKDSF